MSELMLSIGEAAKLIGVCENTLRDWDIEGKFKASRTTGGHRRYSLEQVREYLEENPLQQDKPKPVPAMENLCELVKKWEDKGYLSDLEAESEKKVLARLLQNCADSREYMPEEPVFSTKQILWLTQQGWLRSKFRKMVSVQPLPSPAGLIYFVNKDNVLQSEAVAAKTEKYDFSIFGKADFEQIKETYADAIAAYLDFHIFQRLPQCEIETLLDAAATAEESVAGMYDYIIGPSSSIGILKNSKLCEGVDLFPMPAVLNPDTFMPMAAAGKYRNGMFGQPIFAPYVLAWEAPAKASGSCSLLMRVGWYPE